jgi:hypothetical protein
VVDRETLVWDKTSRFPAGMTRKAYGRSRFLAVTMMRKTPEGWLLWFPALATKTTAWRGWGTQAKATARIEADSLRE